MRKLSTETRQVLMVMLDAPREETYGFELTRVAGLASGTVYPILRRLEDMEWVASRWETIDESHTRRRRRRYYRLTAKGLAEAHEAVAAQAPGLRQLVPGWGVA
jgi:PadR family transcriptional regulator, regulatory protein PadR